MSLFFDSLLILLGYAIYGVIHSYTASLRLKKIVRKKWRHFLPFYRITFNIISIVLFLILLRLVPKPNLIIYDLPNPYDLLMLIPQFLSLAGLIWSFFYFDGLEFLGIRQIMRAIKGTYNYDELDESSIFRADGPYRFSRHPLYLFSILFLLFRPVMTLFYLVFWLGTVGYFYAGAYFEEKKLRKMFGVEYEEYRKNVPMIVPLKFPLKK